MRTCHSIPCLQVGVLDVGTTLHAAPRVEAQLQRRGRVDTPVQARITCDARVECDVNERVALVAQLEFVIGRHLGNRVSVDVGVVGASGLDNNSESKCNELSIPSLQRQ